MNSENEELLYSLKGAILQSAGGFYSVIASSKTQRELVKLCGGEDVAVHDFAGERRQLVEIANLMDDHPGRRAYLFLNFHLALWDSAAGEWNVDAARRLDFSRDPLARRGETMIFFMTPEADDLLSRRAMNFYDYIKLFLRFQDAPEEREEEKSLPAPDRSRGVEEVEIDYTLPKNQLLIQAISLGHQAEELYGKARYADALYLNKKQKEIRERVLGLEDVDTAESCNNIGVVYATMGDNPAALEWYQKALSIQESVLGPEHPDTAMSYNNIGAVYRAMGDNAAALEWHKKALSIRESVLGAEHPSTAMTYNNIGNVYRAMGDNATALEWHKKALSIQERVLGPEHLNTAISYNNIGNVYRAMGDNAAALEWHKKALSIQEKILGPEHPDTGKSCNNIGNVYAAMGDNAIALKWFLRALPILEGSLGAEHPDTKKLYRNLARCYEKLGES